MMRISCFAERTKPAKRTTLGCAWLYSEKGDNYNGKDCAEMQQGFLLS